MMELVVVPTMEQMPFLSPIENALSAPFPARNNISAALLGLDTNPCSLLGAAWSGRQEAVALSPRSS